MTATATQTHPFEIAGLGLAPFRYVGMEQQAMRDGRRVIGDLQGIEISTKPGGTCDYCGQYIVNVFNIQSADGKRFHVGCDCLKKTADAELIRVVNQDVKKHKAQAKLSRETARIAAATGRLPLVSDQLKAAPHPSEGLARQGKTLLDWVQWMLENAGQSGKLRAASVIERMDRK